MKIIAAFLFAVIVGCAPKHNSRDAIQAECVAGYGKKSPVRVDDLTR